MSVPQTSRPALEPTQPPIQCVMGEGGDLLSVVKRPRCEDGKLFQLGVHRVLVGKPEGKRPMGRPRRRWEDNIKTDLQEVGGGCGTGWSWFRIGTGGGHL